MFDTDSSDSGRVKGSIKDRLISFLYRKRLKIKLVKNGLVKKATRIRFAYIKKMEVKNYRDLKMMGDKVIEVDVGKEKFDFDRYDYYIIEPVKKKGIDTKEISEVNNTKKVINEIKVILDNTKKDIKKIDINMKYPESHKEDLSKEVNNINSNKNRLKNKLTKLDDVDIKRIDSLIVPSNEEEVKYAYEVINYYDNVIKSKESDTKVVEAISNVKFSKNIGIGVNNNDNYNNSIKNIKIYKTSKEDKKIESKKKINVLNKFDGFKIRQLKRNEEIVKKDVESAASVVDKMNKEVDKVTKEISQVTKTIGYSRMIASVLRVATGILTLPFSKVNLFNITLGSSLINRGLKGLRKGLETKTEIKVDYKYEDLSNMIKATKDKTKLTELLIMDSLTEIKSIKEYTYLGRNNIRDLNKLEENLNKKLKEIDRLNKKLNKQEEKNKIKIKNVEEKNKN